jgi:hypothetical protein
MRAQRFSGRRGHRVVGLVNGKPFKSSIVARSGKSFLLLDAPTLYAAGASSGDRVEVEVKLAPVTPSRRSR